MSRKSGPFRIGVIGANPEQGWASMSHLPALQSLPQFELVAVSTSRQATAEQSAKRFGAKLAFADPLALIRHPDVDVVTVAVKAPLHHDLTMAAVAEGKHVYCEWPLGANLAQTEEMASAVRSAKVHSAIGLQGRASPWVNAIRDLIAGGKLGRILSTSIIASGGMMGATVAPRSLYTLDRANGATMMTISLGHLLDSVLYCLGDITELSSLLATQNKQVKIGDSGETAPMSASDQILVNGTLESGAVLSLHMRGGMSKGTNLLWEINGTGGDLVISSGSGFVHFGPLDIRLGQGGAALEPVTVEPTPTIAPELSGKPAFNVACNYLEFARAISGESSRCADFFVAAKLHRLLDLIHASDKQRARLVHLSAMPRPTADQ